MPQFKKNNNLESLLETLNAHLSKAEESFTENVRPGDSGFASVIKLGCPRSGGTLLTQWALTSGAFAVPTNFISRFYLAPGIGSLISKMINDPRFDYRNEFSDIKKEIEFKSDIGKTTGFNSTHEFWYLWRHNFDIPDVPSSEEAFSAAANFDRFNRSLEIMQLNFEKPLLLKGHLVNFYSESINRGLHNCIFIHLRRDPIAMARSLLRAREKWTGSIDNWFSHKPREYEELVNLTPIEQVVGQIYFTEREILSKKNLLGDRYIEISYETLCKHPKQIFDQVIDKVAHFSKNPVNRDYKGSESFQFSNPTSSELDSKLKKALTNFESKHGELDWP